MHLITPLCITRIISVICLFYFSLYVEAKPSVEDFVKNPTSYDAALSPSGRYLAQIWVNDGLRVVTVQDLDSPGHPIIGRVGDNIIRAWSISWANEDRLLVSILIPYGRKNVRKKSKKEVDFNIDEYRSLTRTFAMDRDGKNRVYLLNDIHNVNLNSNLSRIRHFLPKEPSSVLMMTHRRSKSVLYKVNVYTGESELKATGSRYTYNFINDINGNVKYRLDYRRKSRTVRIYEYTKNQKWNEIENIFVDSDTKDGINIQDFLGLYNNELVYRKANKNTGYYELIAYNSSTKQYRTIISLPNQDVGKPVINIRTNDIVGYSVEKDSIRYHLFKDKDQKSYDKLAKHMENYNFFTSSFSNSSRSIIVKSGRNLPQSFHLYNSEENLVKLIAESYPELTTGNLSIPAKVTYYARDKLKIRAYILLPADYEQGKRYPMVVLPHGGPQYRDRASYDNFAQFISTRGYIVIQPNFRGSIGYGKKFEELGYQQWGMAMQNDLTDAVSFMVKKGFANSERVCIVGLSYGGYAALMGAVKTPKQYRCSVSINGVTHLPEMIAYDKKEIDNNDITDEYVFKRIGHPDKNKSMLLENSPALQVKKIENSILLIAGTQDRVVPFKQAKIMSKALKKHKKNYEFIKIKNGNHYIFRNKNDMEKIYSKVEKFLAKHLLN